MRRFDPSRTFSGGLPVNYLPLASPDPYTGHDGRLAVAVGDASGNGPPVTFSPDCTIEVSYPWEEEFRPAKAVTRALAVERVAVRLSVLDLTATGTEWAVELRAASPDFPVGVNGLSDQPGVQPPDYDHPFTLLPAQNPGVAQDRVAFNPAGNDIGGFVWTAQQLVWNTPASWASGR